MDARIAARGRSPLAILAMALAAAAAGLLAAVASLAIAAGAAAARAADGPPVLLASSSAGPAPAAPAVSSTSAAPPIVQLRLSMSNIHLVKAARPVLIDAGSSGDLPALTAALAEHGLSPRDLALVVLTHAHSDHAGLAAGLQRAGATIVLGSGDAAMAAAGRNDDLKPTSVMAWLLKHLAIDPAFERFVPDLRVRDALDLAPWGIAGRAMALPGHTPGSLAIVLDSGDAFVGDLALGGFLGGALLPHHAGEHYFHADRDANRANIARLLALPVQRFHLGHGGPVDRASMLRAFGQPADAAAAGAR